MNTRLWGILVVLLAVLGGMSWYLSKLQNTPERVQIKPLTAEDVRRVTGEQPVTLKKATKVPGRVVVVNTARGKIEFVLYEKDCPKTTARVVDLIQGGFYDHITFPRVEDWVIQTTPATRDVVPMGVELTSGLTHVRGTVGMARTEDLNSGTSVFYILRKPAQHLDSGYTNFGRVIRGMDVADKIRLNDKINSVTLRALSAADKQALAKELGTDPH
jgi:peptidyl-prolyl cis-trans isomerase B (cyclophilin B)